MKTMDLIRKTRDYLDYVELTITTFVGGTIAHLLVNDFDVLYLDHDLDGQSFQKSGENTGFEVAEWLSKKPPFVFIPPEIYIHSLNPEGVKNMKRVLPDAIEKPYAWLADDAIDKMIL